jgi:predicted porin
MKKSLLALAVLGSFAGAASAQTSNVTIYGVLDEAIQRTQDGGKSVTGLVSGQNWGSRLGFKGTEDLGGGLAANFRIENGFNADTGTAGQGGRLFGRWASVGLSSTTLGAINFGRMDALMKGAVDAADPFDLGMTTGADGLGDIFSTGGWTIDNDVIYSLNVGPVSAAVSYAFGEVAGSTATGQQFGVRLGYTAGPLNVVGAFEKKNLVTGTAEAGKVKSFFLGGSYDFGMAKLFAGFASDKQQNAAGADVSTLGTSYATGVTGYGLQTGNDRKYTVGVAVPTGPSGTILASYAKVQDKTSADKDANYWGLGYNYVLSKRTSFYASYSRMKVDTWTNNASWLNVGIDHTF